MTRISILLIASLAFSGFAGGALADSQNTRNHKAAKETAQKHETRTHKGQTRTKHHQDSRGGNAKPVVVQKSVQKEQRRNVGHRFNKRDVVVIQDWDRRGLRRPGHGEVYAVRGDAIYLLAATSLIVKAIAQ